MATQEEAQGAEEEEGEEEEGTGEEEEEGTGEEDEHMCLRCGRTIIGLENYIAHRRSRGCSSSMRADGNGGRGRGNKAESVESGRKDYDSGVVVQPAVSSFSSSSSLSFPSSSTCNSSTPLSVYCSISPSAISTTTSTTPRPPPALPPSPKPAAAGSSEPSETSRAAKETRPTERGAVAEIAMAEASEEGGKVNEGVGEAEGQLLTNSGDVPSSTATCDIGEEARQASYHVPLLNINTGVQKPSSFYSTSSNKDVGKEEEEEEGGERGFVSNRTSQDTENISAISGSQTPDGSILPAQSDHRISSSYRMEPFEVHAQIEKNVFTVPDVFEEKNGSVSSGLHSNLSDGQTFEQGLFKVHTDKTPNAVLSGALNLEGRQSREGEGMASGAPHSKQHKISCSESNIKDLSNVIDNSNDMGKTNHQICGDPYLSAPAPAEDRFVSSLSKVSYNTRGSHRYFQQDSNSSAKTFPCENDKQMKSEESNSLFQEYPISQRPQHDVKIVSRSLIDIPSPSNSEIFPIKEVSRESILGQEASAPQEAPEVQQNPQMNLDFSYVYGSTGGSHGVEKTTTQIENYQEASAEGHPKKNTDTVMQKEDIRQDDFLSSLELRSSVKVAEERSKFDLEDDQLDEDEDDDDMYNRPPQHHTGGKWKPGARPPLYVGGKWQPSIYKDEGQEEEEEDAEDHVNSQEARPSPPPGYTKGKWLPGKRITNLQTSGSPITYHCDACDRTLKGKVAYDRHLHSHYHFLKESKGVIATNMNKRKLEGESSDDIPTRPVRSKKLKAQKFLKSTIAGFKRKKALATESDLDTKTSIRLHQTSKEKEAPASASRAIKIEVKQEMLSEEEVEDVTTTPKLMCPICRLSFAQAFAPRHFASLAHIHNELEYRQNRNEESDDAYHKIILKNIGDIVPKLNLSCQPCRFYCSLHEDLITHMGTHRTEDSEDLVKLLYSCSACSEEEPLTIHSFLRHLKTTYHQQNIMDEIMQAKQVVIMTKSAIVCPLCEKVFRYFREYRNHRRKVHEEKMFELRHQRLLKCPKCNHLALHERQIRVHLRQVHGRRAAEGYHCFVCGLSYSTALEASQHRQSATHRTTLELQRGQASTRTCDLCYQKLPDLMSLRSHMTEIHDADCMPCAYCGQRFPLPSDLAVHQKVCKGFLEPQEPAGSYTCDLCTFSNDLLAHVLSHTTIAHGQRDDNKRYPCHLCKTRLKQPSIKGHMLNHTNERPFVCHMCSRKFLHREWLDKHLQIVHSTNVNEADIATGSDVRQEQSESDLRGQEPGSGGQGVTDPVLCDQCGHTFTNRSHLTRHRVEVHIHATPSRPEPLPSCQTAVDTPPSISTRSSQTSRRRKQVATILCDVCGVLCSDHRQLKAHRRDHHQAVVSSVSVSTEDVRSRSPVSARQYVCPHCNYTTRHLPHLRRHLRLHTGAKPFHCPFCDYSCNNQENLRKHMVKTRRHPGRYMYECSFCPADTSSKEQHPNLSDDPVTSFAAYTSSSPSAPVMPSSASAPVSSPSSSVIHPSTEEDASTSLLFKTSPSELNQVLPVRAFRSNYGSQYQQHLLKEHLGHFGTKEEVTRHIRSYYKPSEDTTVTSTPRPFVHRRRPRPDQGTITGEAVDFEITEDDPSSDDITEDGHEITLTEEEVGVSKTLPSCQEPHQEEHLQQHLGKTSLSTNIATVGTSFPQEDGGGGESTIPHTVVVIQTGDQKLLTDLHGASAFSSEKDVEIPACRVLLPPRRCYPRAPGKSAALRALEQQRRDHIRQKQQQQIQEKEQDQEQNQQLQQLQQLHQPQEEQQLQHYRQDQEQQRRRRTQRRQFKELQLSEHLQENRSQISDKNRMEKVFPPQSTVSPAAAPPVSKITAVVNASVSGVMAQPMTSMARVIATVTDPSLPAEVAPDIHALGSDHTRVTRMNPSLSVEAQNSVVVEHPFQSGSGHHPKPDVVDHPITIHTKEGNPSVDMSTSDGHGLSSHDEDGSKNVILILPEELGGQKIDLVTLLPSLGLDASPGEYVSVITVDSDQHGLHPEQEQVYQVTSLPGHRFGEIPPESSLHQDDGHSHPVQETQLHIQQEEYQQLQEQQQEVQLLEQPQELHQQEEQHQHMHQQQEQQMIRQQERQGDGQEQCLAPEKTLLMQPGLQINAEQSHCMQMTDEQMLGSHQEEHLQQNQHMHETQYTLHGKKLQQEQQILKTQEDKEECSQQEEHAYQVDFLHQEKEVKQKQHQLEEQNLQGQGILKSQQFPQEQKMSLGHHLPQEQELLYERQHPQEEQLIQEQHLAGEQSLTQEQQTLQELPHETDQEGQDQGEIPREGELQQKDSFQEQQKRPEQEILVQIPQDHLQLEHVQTQCLRYNHDIKVEYVQQEQQQLHTQQQPTQSLLERENCKQQKHDEHSHQQSLQRHQF